MWHPPGPSPCSWTFLLAGGQGKDEANKVYRVSCWGRERGEPGGDLSEVIREGIKKHPGCSGPDRASQLCGRGFQADGMQVQVP